MLNGHGKVRGESREVEATGEGVDELHIGAAGDFSALLKVRRTDPVLILIIV